ncbi:MAG TPA: hypothetical protein VM144_04175 [Aestuariivirga sp.]|nr:hypothetical protein [Aestuariivirga sp.]
MSKLMFIFGILFLAAGVALGFLIHFSPGEMQVRGLTADVAAILVVGGALCLGLGSTIGALRDRTVAPVVAEVVAETPEEKPATPKFTGFGKKAAATAVVAEASAAVAETAAASKTSVADTVAALEQAKTDIAVALGVEPQKAAPQESVAAASEPEEKAEAADGELYVVEEKVIRGRPARVLSDGTVEAETDDGWMRFENLEHLDEYLEAMVPEA